MGTVKSLDFLAAKVFREVTKINSVVIVGGGTVGLMLAECLEQADISCKIFEKNYERCEYISTILKIYRGMHFIIVKIWLSYMVQTL